MQKQLLGRKIMARIRYRLEYIPRKTTFRFVIFTTQYQRQRKCFFFSERELRKALRDTLTRATWYGLLFTTANLY